jgi:hypothetical protein
MGSQLTALARVQDIEVFAQLVSSNVVHHHVGRDD